MADSSSSSAHELVGDDVVISHHGRQATALRPRAAQPFAADVVDQPWQLMVRVTGSHQRGDERAAQAGLRDGGGEVTASSPALGDDPRLGRRAVVRVGETLHVGPHRQSAYIAHLLRHLERSGFDGAPRWLGRGDDGQDVLTYVEGVVPSGDPPYNLNDAQLTAASHLVLRFHDAAAGSPLCRGAETVCHGDLGPHNTVFRNGRPVAIIDWDEDVGPGSRAVDFADAVWSFADLTSALVPVAEQARRVGLMCAAYRGITPGIVVRELKSQFERARSNHADAGRAGPRGVFEGLVQWLDRHGPTIAADR